MKFLYFCRYVFGSNFTLFFEQLDLHEMLSCDFSREYRLFARL